MLESDSMEKVTPIEEKIVSYLALHPRRNIQQIQRGLGIEDRNYPTVRNAMSRLKKKDLVEATQGKSEKKVLVSFFRLSVKGIGYALAYGNDHVALQVPAIYEDVEPQLKNFVQIEQHLSPPIMLKLLRIVGKGVIQYGEKCLQTQIIAILAIEGLHALSEKEYAEFKKACAKVPSVKSMVDKTFKTLSRFSLEE